MSSPEKFGNSFEDEGNGVWVDGTGEILKQSRENEQKGVALDESQKLEDELRSNKLYLPSRSCARMDSRLL